MTALYNAGRAGGALNISPAIVRTVTPKLSVKVSDPEANAQIWSEIEIRTAPSDTAALLQSSSGMGPHTSSTIVGMTVSAGKLSNGGTYYWRAYSVDELAWNSGWSPFQAVKVDTSPPVWSASAVVSAEYPQRAWGKVAGTVGSFTFSSASSDVAEFEWWVDNTPTHNTVPASGTTTRTATVSYTPSTSNSHYCM